MAICCNILIDTPLTSYSAIRLLFIAAFEKLYYLVPISFLICIFMFYNAFAVHKQQVVLPVILCVYLLYDSIALISNFIDSLSVYDRFIASHFMRIIINILVMALMCIYFVILRKQKFSNKNQTTANQKFNHKQPGRCRSGCL